MRQGQRVPRPDSEQLVLSLIDDIYSASLEPSLWTGVIKRIVEAVGGATGQLVSPNESATTSLWAPYGFGRETMEPYARYYHKVDVWTQRADALRIPPCSILTGEQMVNSSAFMRSEYYNDFLKRYDFQRIVACFVDDGKSGDVPKTSLSIYRPPGSEPFDQDAVNLLGQIAPHVRRAIRLHWRIHDLEHKRASNTEALEHLTVGIALVDESHRVTYLNQTARKIVNANGGLNVVDGELAAAVSAETVELSRLLAEATRAAVSLNGRRTGSIMVTRTTSGLPYRVSVIPMPARGAFVVGRQHTAAIVFISESQLTRQASVDLVARIHALSPAETRLLQILLDGKPLKKVAAILDVTVNTAHTQLSNIYRKTGAHRQVDLANLVMSVASIINF